MPFIIFTFDLGLDLSHEGGVYLFQSFFVLRYEEGFGESLDMIIRHVWFNISKILLCSRQAAERRRLEE